MQKRFLLLLPALLSATSVLAQAPADSAGRRLGEVTVYGLRLLPEQPAAQAGRYVTVVPGALLARYPVASLDDLLRLLPNLEIQSRGHFGTQADVTLRGSTFNQVLLLLDGMRLNDPLTGHFAGYLPITPAEIEQIEVVRGPGAALYGPDAVGGFINIVTKTFAATHRPDAVALDGTFLSGEYGLRSVNAGFAGQQQGLRLAGGILNNSATGQLLDLPGGGRGDFRLNTYSLSGACQLTDKLSAAGRVAFDRRDYNAQNYYTTSLADRARETTGREWYQGQLRYDWQPGARTELQVVSTPSTDNYRFTPTSVASDHQMRYFNVQGLHQWQARPGLSASLGGQADRRAITSNDRGDHTLWHLGAFAVAALTPTTDLSVTAALRLDHDQSYGTELLPQLTAAYAGLLPEQRLTLRAAAGRAIRAPNFTEQYNSAIRPGIVPSGFNVGYAGLAAERTWSYEAGADFRLSPAVLLRGTYFYRRGDNLIDYVSRPGAEVIALTGLGNLSPTATYRVAQNLFRVATQGLETELTTRAALGPALRLEGTAGYTFVALDVAGDVLSQYLSNVARHLAAGNLSLVHPRFTVSFGGLWKVRAAQQTVVTPTNGQLDARLTPSYAVFNARLEAALVPERVWLVGQAQNLFDAVYADVLGAPMPRRWLMGGVRVALRR